MGDAMFAIPGPTDPSTAVIAAAPMPELGPPMPYTPAPDWTAALTALDRLTAELAALRADLAARSFEGRLRRLGAWLARLWSRLTAH
jgi:hypothetical protein